MCCLPTAFLSCRHLLSAGADFDVVSMLIASFPVGSNNGTLLCLNVTITNDFAFEKDEYFFVEVEPEAGVAILENRATVIIQDDDGESPFTKH